MENKKPFFSVIVPIHNRPEVISKCLQSIGNQKFDDFETVYVCDNCDDETIQWVKDNQLHVQHWFTVDDLKWLYTAITRAKKKVYLVNFKDELFQTS